MLYDCRDIGGFLEVTLVWIHPIHQILCRTQWSRVGNNIDSIVRLREPSPLTELCKSLMKKIVDSNMILFAI